MVFLQKLLGDLPAAQIMIFPVNARRLMTEDIGTLLLLSGKTSFNHYLKKWHIYTLKLGREFSRHPVIISRFLL